jgi:hypothetical protein
VPESDFVLKYVKIILAGCHINLYIR